jgi:hypothetical protein
VSGGVVEEFAFELVSPERGQDANRLFLEIDGSKKFNVLRAQDWPELVAPFVERPEDAPDPLQLEPRPGAEDAVGQFEVDSSPANLEPVFLDPQFELVLGGKTALPLATHRAAFPSRSAAPGPPPEEVPAWPGAQAAAATPSPAATPPAAAAATPAQVEPDTTEWFTPAFSPAPSPAVAARDDQPVALGSGTKLTKKRHVKKL